MDIALAQSVRRRAGNRCEYCKMSAAVYRTVFHVDHVIAVKHGGPTVFDNLALACLHCNLHKGTDIASLDPSTRQHHAGRVPVGPGENAQIANEAAIGSA